MLGDLPHALDDQNAVINLAPRLPDAYLSRGLIFQAMDQPKEAIADFSTAIRLNPQMLGAYIDRGNVIASSMTMPPRLRI